MGKGKIVALFMVLALAMGVFPGIALAVGDDLQAGGLTTQDDTQAKVELERSFEGDRVYEGQTVDFAVHVGDIDGVEGSDWELAIKVGQFMTFDDEAGEFEHSFTEGDEYTFDKVSGVITIDGTKALAKLKTWDGPSGFIVRARIVNPSNNQLIGDDKIYEAIDGMEVWAPRIDLDRKWDRAMLPDWGDWIDRKSKMYVENAEFPWGENFEYEVTNVETSDDHVVSVEEKDGGWDLRAKGYGSATLTVTYNNPEALGGGEDSYQYEINVASDVYEAWIETESGSDMSLPGKTIELIADCKHDFNDDSQNADEEFTCEWSLAWGDDIATITPHADDPWKATVTFNALDPEGLQGGVWEDARARIAVKGAGGEERVNADIDLHMASEYTEIWPTRNDKRLVFGSSESITAELRSYPGTNGEEYDIIDDAKFSWENVNTDAVRILDENDNEVEYGAVLDGKTFTIQRLENWWTDFKLVARWGDEGNTERWYRYEELNTNIWLNAERDKVYSDGTLDLALDIDEALNPHDVSYTVGLWDGDTNDGEGDWAKTFEKGEGWTVSDDNKTVMLNGAGLFAKDEIENGTWVRVYAELIMNDEVISCNDFNVEVRDARNGHDINDCDFRLVTKDDGGNDIYTAVDGAWALVFLKGKDATFVPTVELYDGNELVDPRNYTVKFERSWWDGDEHMFETVDAIGFPSDDQAQSNFRIVIEPVAGSCYMGTYDRETASIEAVNEYALDSRYTDMYFETPDGMPFTGVVDDRINGMNPNYHVVPATMVTDYLNGFKLRTGGTFSYEENTHNGKLLTLGTDYSITYYKADPDMRDKNPSPATMAIVGDPLPQAPTAPGSYVLVVKGKGLYDGSDAVLFDIQANADDIEIASIPNQEWTGSAITPKLTVKCNGQVVDPSLYKVEYANNTGAGEATVTVSGVNPILHWTYNQGLEKVEMVPDENDRFFNATKTVSFKIIRWNAPTYSWAKDKSSVMAKRICVNDAALVQSETVKTTSTTTKATLTKSGKIVYMAQGFKNKAFKKQTKTVTIAKNNMKVTVTKKTVKSSAVKKRDQTVKPITVKNSKGKMSYAKITKGSSKFLTVNKKTGKITVKKGAKVGSYKINVKATSAATSKYAAVNKTLTVTITVK